MLNKELLMVGSEKGQIKVRLTIGMLQGTSDIFGYHKLFGFGSLEPLPYWGTSDTSGINLWYSKSDGRTYCTTPFGVSEVVTVFAEGYSLPLVSDSDAVGDIFGMADQTGSARYLTFDPPRRLLRSKDTQTDLERGYYVEEAHWEAQDAE